MTYIKKFKELTDEELASIAHELLITAYTQLRSHHIDETTALRNRIRELSERAEPSEELARWRLLGGDLVRGAMLAALGKNTTELEDQVATLTKRVKTLEYWTMPERNLNPIESEPTDFSIEALVKTVRERLFKPFVNEDFLLAQQAELKRLIDAYNEDPLAQIGFNARLEEVTKELKELERSLESSLREVGELKNK